MAGVGSIAKTSGMACGYLREIIALLKQIAEKK